MNRRGFLGSILALGAAPAIVRADSLMRIVPMETGIILPDDISMSMDEYIILYCHPDMMSDLIDVRMKEPIKTLLQGHVQSFDSVKVVRGWRT